VTTVTPKTRKVRRAPFWRHSEQFPTALFSKSLWKFTRIKAAQNETLSIVKSYQYLFILSRKLFILSRREVGPPGLAKATVSIFHSLAMSRPPHIPAGSWPLEMRAETAAAYYDEPSVEAFHAKVRLGIYPPPMREKGCLPKWHRWKLDIDIARRHGLRLDNVAISEDVTELI
jgi:hypothetical protein